MKCRTSLCWKYFHENEISNTKGKHGVTVKCKFCNFQIMKNTTRMTSHLAKHCKLCPEDIKIAVSSNHELVLPKAEIKFFDSSNDDSPNLQIPEDSTKISEPYEEIHFKTRRKHERRVIDDDDDDDDDDYNVIDEKMLEMVTTDEISNDSDQESLIKDEYQNEELSNDNAESIVVYESLPSFTEKPKKRKTVAVINAVCNLSKDDKFKGNFSVEKALLEGKKLNIRRKQIQLEEQSILLLEKKMNLQLEERKIELQEKRLLFHEKLSQFQKSQSRFK